MIKFTLGVVLGAVLTAQFPQETRVATTHLRSWINESAGAVERATTDEPGGIVLKGLRTIGEQDLFKE